GIGDILVSNEVVSSRKLARLAALSRMSKISLCADSAAVVDQIEAVAESFATRLTVLVEIDVSGGRCGVEPGAPAAALAVRIARSRHLVFGGLQSYHGRAQHLRAEQERRDAIGQSAPRTSDPLSALRA
ncbi:alanine racemase, partial [Mesorhizobium sp. M7A.F.Ca.CA.004.05.2.1]|uniref:alanine racemase n=1 Tax=Mesorhizobium sp. M7A.F.Ca.CA.004.05.2.1 TaxID=2496716 RepID=UPI000FD483EC